MSRSPSTDTHNTPTPEGMRHRLAVWWVRFTDLGAGAFFLVLGVIVVILIVVGVIMSRGTSAQPHACDQARPTVTRMEHLQGPLTAAQATQLHHAATQLRSYADQARGDEAKAVNDAADVAASATAGQKLDTSHLRIEFDSVCSQIGTGEGDGVRPGL